jgi:HEAT repeat protein
MKEEKAQVREVIAAAIGTIGLPEGEQCVENLIKCLSNADEDPNVKAMCVWSLGRLATHQTGQKSKKILVAALKDSYWKVRAAACTAVA